MQKLLLLISQTEQRPINVVKSATSSPCQSKQLVKSAHKPARLEKIAELLTKRRYPTEMRRPMAKRLLHAASEIENTALADAISRTKTVYITGIQRQRMSNVRTLLRLAGKFGAKEVLNISFVDRHITTSLCGYADIANNLKEYIQLWPKSKALTDFDPLDARSASCRKPLQRPPMKPSLLMK